MSLSPTELQRYALALQEAKARGLPIPQQKKKEVHRVEWKLGGNGYFVRNDGKLYNPKPNQAGFISSRSRFVGFSGGRGSGKTAGGAQKALFKIMQGNSGAAMNPDFENFKTSTWPELKEWIPWDMVVPKHRYRRSDSWEPIRPFTMVFKNGARIYCKGLKDPDSARGPNINW